MFFRKTLLAVYLLHLMRISNEDDDDDDNDILVANNLC